MDNDVSLLNLRKANQSRVWNERANACMKREDDK